MALVAVLTLALCPLTNAWEPGPEQGGDPCENMLPMSYPQAVQCLMYMMMDLGIPQGQWGWW